MTEDTLKEMAREIAQKQSLMGIVLTMEILKSLRIVRDRVIKQAADIAMNKGYTVTDAREIITRPDERGLQLLEQANYWLRAQNKFISDNIKRIGKPEKESME